MKKSKITIKSFRLKEEEERKLLYINAKADVRRYYRERKLDELFDTKPFFEFKYDKFWTLSRKILFVFSLTNREMHREEMYAYLFAIDARIPKDLFLTSFYALVNSNVGIASDITRKFVYKINYGSRHA